MFRLKPVTGKFNATRWRASEYPMPALMSVALCDSIFHNPAAIGQTCFNPYFIGSKSPVTNYRVMAILPQHKLGDYERYEPFIYLPLSDDDMGWWMHFAVRVSPDAVSGFAGRFLNDMQPKLAIGPYYLYEVHSYSDMKEAYDLEQGTVNYLNATYSILSFFMELQVEVRPEYYSDEINKMLELKKKLTARLQSVLGLGVAVRLVEPRSIERSTGKAKRVIDNRKI